MVWDSEILNNPRGDGSAAVRFRYRSVDGEEGYPGSMLTELVYTVTERNELWLECALPPLLVLLLWWWWC